VNLGRVIKKRKRNNQRKLIPRWRAVARQTQLVCQHQENISHEALSKHQDVMRSYVRGRQGIYALYRKNEQGIGVRHELLRYNNRSDPRR